MARQVLTRRYVRDVLDAAMGSYWDDEDVSELFSRLKDRFPRHVKTLARIEELAGDNSNERWHIDCDKGADDVYSHNWDKVMRAVDRLPWDKFGG